MPVLTNTKQILKRHIKRKQKVKKYKIQNKIYYKKDTFKNFKRIKYFLYRIWDFWGVSTKKTDKKNEFHHTRFFSVERREKKNRETKMEKNARKKGPKI